MSTNSPDVYNNLSFEQWQTAISKTFNSGIMCEPVEEDFKQILRVFRELFFGSNQTSSRIDLFLLGFRTMCALEKLNDDPEFLMDLDSGEVPEAVAYKAVEETLERLGERPKSILEIVIIHHLEVYIKALDAEKCEDIFNPFGLCPASFMFLCGYLLIYRLNVLVDD